MKTIIMSLACGMTLFLGNFIQELGWKAPEHADKTENPLIANKTAADDGKKIFQKLCWSCHGESGKGDGPASVNLKIKPANFGSAAFQSQTDGAIYYKLSEGRGEMASYKNILSSKQRWQTINYLRTLK